MQDEYDKAKNRISIKYQQQKDAQTMEEKEAASRERVNVIEQKLKDMQEEYKKERKKRYWISGILGIVVALLVFVICYQFWGWSSITFIVSGIAGVISVLSGIVTLRDFFINKR